MHKYQYTDVVIDMLSIITSFIEDDYDKYILVEHINTLISDMKSGNYGTDSTR